MGFPDFASLHRSFRICPGYKAFSRILGVAGDAGSGHGGRTARRRPNE